MMSRLEKLKNFMLGLPTEQELQGETVALSTHADADFGGSQEKPEQEGKKVAEHDKDCHDYDREHCHIQLSGYMHCHDKDPCYEAQALKFPCNTKPDDVVAAVAGLGPNVIPIQLVNFGALGWVLFIKKPM